MGFQRMNKKGMEFKSGLFAIVAVGIVIVAFGVIITEQNKVYNSGTVSEISSLNKMENVSEISSVHRASISPNDDDPGEDPEANTFRGAYGILTGIFTSFDLVVGNDGMIADVSDRYGIPNYIRQGIITIITIAIIFSLIAVIFRLARRSA